MGSRARPLALLAVAAATSWAGAARAQEQLGHKLLGTLGLDAGVEPPPGLTLIDQVVLFGAEEIADRHGDPVPISGLDLDAFGNVVGISGTVRIPGFAMWTGAVAFPYARLSLNIDDPRASLDRYGFGDVYVLPLKLGWRPGRFDVVASYSFYAPTGHFEPRGSTGIGRGFWTHELAAGGTAWLDQARTLRLSALGSYDLSGKKRGIDITRGSTAQIQGGAGVRLVRVLDVGVAGYALWQVTDDRGSDLPAAVRGASERALGAGPEVDLAIPQIRARLGARYEQDLYARSRPRARIFVFSLSFTAWKPSQRGP